MTPAELVEDLRALGCPNPPTVEAAAVWLEAEETRRLLRAHELRECRARWAARGVHPPLPTWELDERRARARKGRAA
jgi:hypothetical protein